MASSSKVNRYFQDVLWLRINGVSVGSLIKPSFPQPGLKHPSRANVTPADIALATVILLSRSVPPAVPGVLFLSGMIFSVYVPIISMTILRLFRWVAASHGNAISRSCERARPGVGSDFSIFQTASANIFLWKSFAR